MQGRKATTSPPRGAIEGLVVEAHGILVGSACSSNRRRATVGSFWGLYTILTISTLNSPTRRPSRIVSDPANTSTPPYA